MPYALSQQKTTSPNPAPKAPATDAESRLAGSNGIGVWTSIQALVQIGAPSGVVRTSPVQTRAPEAIRNEPNGRGRKWPERK